MRFLEVLAENNNREWFQARKTDYEQHVLGPSQDFVAALGQRLEELSDGILYDTRADGRGSILRIYRDVRFSKDKRPYNTNVRVFFWEGTRKKMENPGFFVRVSPTGAGVFGGKHQFPKRFLAAYREAVVDEELGDELERALEAVRAAGGLSIGGEHYKRVPRGYDPEHKRAELLKYNGLYAHTGGIGRDTVTIPELVDVCFVRCSSMAPLHHWLVSVGERFGV